MRTSLLLTILLIPLTSHALDFEHRDTVLMTDINGITAGRLGQAVGVNQGSVFMGAPVQDGQTTQVGATYLFDINGQREMEFVKELDNQDSSPFWYGKAIVTDGDFAAIGSLSGQLIEIHARNGAGWVLLKVIDRPTINDVTIRNFGEIMDLEGDFLVVGDPTANVGGVGSAGVVMIFGRNTGGVNNWGLITHFLDPDPPEFPDFARSVAISSDLMVAGDANNERALLYRRNGNDWSFDKALQPEQVEADDSFGVSVEAEGDYIAVGTLNGNKALDPSNSGSVHIFSRNQGGSNHFGQLTQLYPSAPELIDEFGKSLRLRDGLLIVGAPGAEQVYVFSRLGGAWEEEQLVTPPEGTEFFHALFGVDVDYHRGSLVVGADSWPDIDRVRYGAVFLYEDWGTVLCKELNAIYCDGFENK